ncbi:MAG TPA: two-component regulator propeller domain-containing protein [bacterium]|nr:two-component regulator propeller domain-containing protein [bacterium]
MKPPSLILILILILIFFLALSPAGVQGAEAQPSNSQERELQFRNLTIDQGLAHSKVNCFLQDRQGFIWCGTNEGLNRYDGYDFVVYQQDPANPGGLSANLIRCLAEDEQGYLWIGTEDGGLNRFDRDSGVFQRFGADSSAGLLLSGDNINAMLLDSSGCLWVGTENGLDRISRDRSKIASFFPYPGKAAAGANEILALHLDRGGLLWVGTNSGGLLSFDLSGESFTPYRHLRGDPHSLSDDEIHSICADREGDLWIGTAWGGLNRLERSTGRFSAIHPGAGNPESTTIRALLDDGRGSLWIGNRSGLYRLERSSGVITSHTHDPNNPHSLVQNSVQAIFQDRKGDLWIGTRGGISFLNTTNIPFVHYRADAASRRYLNSQEVYAIMEDRSGDLWFGTESGGINRLDRRSGLFSYYTYEPGNPSCLSVNNIKALLQDRRGNLWIGTFNGGLNLLPGTAGRRFTRYTHRTGDPASLANDNVLALLQDEAGEIWVGTYGGGLDRFNPRTGRFDHLLTTWHDQGFSSVLSLLQDRAGHIWVGGSRTSVGRLDPASGDFRIIRLNDSGRDIQVRALLQDRKGMIWIGTVGAGLFRLDPDSEAVTAFSTRDGLPANVVHGLLEDESGCLWLSTSDGLCRFDPETRRIKCFYKENGLQSNQFNYGAALKTRDGELFFGGINGATGFYPGAIRENTFIPPVVITQFALFNRPVEVNAPNRLLKQEISHTRRIDLSWRHAVFSFEFAALNYALSEQNQYAYIMEGFESEWNHVTHRRFVTYTNLDPGAYTFRVKAANNDGIWNEEGTAIHITISRPFWKTYWFTLLALAALLMLVKLFIDYIRQRRDLLKARSLASLSQLKLLRYQLNPHFLFNALGSIRSMILISQEQAWDMVSALSEFLRYSLLNFNKAEALLDDEITAVTNYLNIEKVRYRDSLQVAVSIDEKARQLVVPAFICQPLVENAIKYGMQTSPLPLQVTLNIRYRDEVLAIDVSNSGRLKPLPDGAKTQSDGHGNSVENIRQRLEIMFREEQNFSLTEEVGMVHARIRITSRGLKRKSLEEMGSKG